VNDYTISFAKIELKRSEAIPGKKEIGDLARKRKRQK
jgi:hypothetical protein